jgi:hypothetical protein
MKKLAMASFDLPMQPHAPLRVPVAVANKAQYLNVSLCSFPSSSGTFEEGRSDNSLLIFDTDTFRAWRLPT